jgi:hypothetical protein
MEQALAQRPTSAAWQNLTFPFALRRPSGMARAKSDTMARYPSGKGGASKLLCVGSSPARATPTFVFHGRREANALPRPLSYCESHKQNPAMIAEMACLLDDYNYADAARILNEKGCKTGDGLPLTSIAVGYVRKAYGLKSRFDRLRERGMLTTSEMARACRVSINTIGHWRQKGWIGAHAINDRTQFLFEAPGQNPSKKYARRVSAITIRQ